MASPALLSLDPTIHQYAHTERFVSHMGTHSFLRSPQVERTLLHMEHTPSSEDLATVIDRAIKKAGLSQRSVAISGGIAPSTFHRKIHTKSGSNPFTYEELRAIASVLGLRLSVLLAEAETDAARHEYELAGVGA